MMLIDEVEEIQNPGLGAALIWRFACGYAAEVRQDAAPIAYAFLVIPLLFNKKILETVVKTKKGLRKVEEKLRAEQSILATSQDSALAMRGLSQEAIALALSTGLISVDPDRATFQPRSTSSPAPQGEGATRILQAAERLGHWASQVSLREFCFVFHLEL
ncbi:three component ABC system middle component [Burkholderia ubonensis]|nr:three component ABC system middle component [Burkholderia ubonensis]KWB53898.1 hypothetical protein WL37_03540 [Burkholderia ubonensis]KWC60258.1 hypothetical protein WL53_12920 [Burkholderia ubonensis]